LGCGEGKQGGLDQVGVLDGAPAAEPDATDAVLGDGQEPAQVRGALQPVEGAFVGAGTVLNEKQLDSAIDAGARFIVSPGLTTPLAEAAIERGIPFLPGIATAADIMRGLDLGLDRFKFFPAETSGGIKALKALAAPFYQVRFCPTGGITAETAPDWLALDAVLCVGGSWLVPAGEPDAQAIEARANACRAFAL
jgi:2-dehydro-3-deoxyphosphogluconate aldolase/(4S)-4-hydroxy-2-oxoglutarate aldolase